MFWRCDSLSALITSFRKDAFTSSGITQHSLAYEKASVIFNTASILSSIASQTNRLGGSSSGKQDASSQAPAAASGTKLAYTALRQAAGMLTYINDNFLHAPSTDMSKDVVRWLVDVSLAQATEVFWERTADEKKGGSLVARIAAQAAALYGSLSEDVKEWVNRGVFERSWALLVQTKHKHFSSVAQYHRALVDESASSHGSCLVRLTLAETLAKDAQKTCALFAGVASSSSNTLPADAASSLKLIVEQHLAIVSARKATAVKDNDLIYHDILPTESILPVIEPMPVAQPISILEIYASPEVQKITGSSTSGIPTNNLFSSLVPLGVHEAASMYSEEKAKLVRGESERVSLADGQLEAALEYMGLPKALRRFKTDGLDELADPGSQVYEWAEEEIQGGGSLGQDGLGTGQEAIDDALKNVRSTREQARTDMDEAKQLLDEEAALCEKLRVQHGERWTQSPSGVEAKSLRSDLKSNREAIEQARGNDQAIEQLWRQSGPLIRVLLGGKEALDGAFAEALSAPQEQDKPQLVDLLQDSSGDETQSRYVSTQVSSIESILTGLHRAKRDRSNLLTELRSKIQADDISQLLTLNRRAPPEAQNHLFQQELEKFRPWTQRISKTVSEQEKLVTEVTRIWKEINDSPVGESMARQWEQKNQARERLISDLRRAKDVNAQVRAGLAKAVAFYSQLQDIAAGIRRSTKSFIEERRIERERLLEELNIQRQSVSPPLSPPNYPPEQSYSLHGAFDRMGLHGARDGTGSSRQGSLPPPAPLNVPYASNAGISPPPPRPPTQASSYTLSSPVQGQPYENLDAAFGQDAPPSHSTARGTYSTTGPQAPYSSQTAVYQQQQPQRTPSLPPPPPQWAPSYGGASHPTYGAPSHPPHVSHSNLEYSTSHTEAPPYQQGYGNARSPSSLASPGPPPPPLPRASPGYNAYAGSQPYSGAGYAGQPPPPPPPQPYQQTYQAQPFSQPPPPPPQNLRWRPPY